MNLQAPPPVTGPPDKQVVYYGQFVEQTRVLEILNVTQSELMQLVFEKKIRRFQLPNKRFLYDLRSAGVQYKLCRRDPNLSDLHNSQYKEIVQTYTDAGDFAVEQKEHGMMLFSSLKNLRFFSKCVRKFCRTAVSRKGVFKRSSTSALPVIVSDPRRATVFHGLKLELVSPNKGSRSRIVAKETTLGGPQIKVPLVIKDLARVFSDSVFTKMNADRWTAICFMMKLFKSESLLEASRSFHLLKQPRVGIDDDAFENLHKAAKALWFRYDNNIQVARRIAGDQKIYKLVLILLNFVRRTLLVNIVKRVPTEEEQLVIHKFLLDFRRDCSMLANLDVFKFAFQSIEDRMYTEDEVREAKQFALQKREAFVLANTKDFLDSKREADDCAVMCGDKEPSPWDDIDDIQV
jgi:hypothetical protein